MSRSALWKRNLVGLLGLAAATGVLVATQLWPQWSMYRHTEVPEQIASAGSTITIDERTWQVILARRLDTAPRPYGPQLPKGVALEVISIARTGSAPPGRVCSASLTDGHRTWASGSLVAVPLAPGTTSVCGGQGTLQLVFEVPADAAPNAVEIKSFEGRLLARMAV